MFVANFRSGAMLSALTLAALCAGSAPAQPQGLTPAAPGTPDAPKAVVVKLTLHPAAAPMPALKYHLLPEVLDLKPGNAALLYQRAHSLEWWGHFLRSGDAEKMSSLLDLPLRKMPRNNVALLQGPLAEMDLAARREYCDWEMTPRLREQGYALLIPDVQGFRLYGQMLALRTRLQMLDGKFDHAVEGMQTGFALSRHVSQAPILINSLVGTAIATLTLEQVEQLVQLEKAPNLYWGLTDLPRPFIDLRRPLQGEKMSIDSIFPEIHAALSDPRLPPVPTQTFDGYIRHIRNLGLPNGQDRFVFAMMAARVYPQAKQYLLDKGFSAEQVTNLPVTQVSLMYAVALFDDYFDEVYKWQTFPYWRARPGLAKAEERIRLLQSEQPVAMSLAAMIPAVNKVSFAKARLDRRIAMLRIVEALRLHAAGDGKLAARLDDMREVPIPIDPVTGKAFEYSANGNSAVLYAGPPHGETASDRNAIRYEITLRK